MKNLPYIIIEGRNMVHDALVHGSSIQTVVFSMANRPDPRLQEIEKLAKQKQIPVKRISPRDLLELSDSPNQGVVALMDLPSTPTLEEILRTKTNPLILLFGQIDYEQNLGAILRSAWAAGADAVIVNPSGVHEITPVVAKVSMGGAAFVPLISQSLFQSLKTLQDYAVPIVGVEVGMGKIYTDSKLTGPIALVFGGEASDISEPVQKYCDSFVNIPMQNNAASLNVSVATALLLFERLRQIRQEQ